jgi:anaerobic nitric oxide reductase transcription regulator
LPAARQLARGRAAHPRRRDRDPAKESRSRPQNRARLGLRGLHLAPEAQAALLAHDWPGNAREQEHLISHAALKALAGAHERPRIVTLDAAHLELAPPAAPGTPAPVNDPAGPVGDLRSAVDRLQRLAKRLGLR